MKYFLHLAYNGTKFRGWQWQPKGRTVQSEIKKVIGTLLQKETSIMGCGRTDAGVHASQYFLHFKSDVELDDQFVFKLNCIMPKDITAFDLIPVPHTLHVQRDAISRTYSYYIHGFKNAFINKMSSYYDLSNFDKTMARKAIDVLRAERDFGTFCLQPDSYKSTICEIFGFELFENEDATQFKIVITANRFLRGMVRLLVATILEIGLGRLTINELEQAIKSQSRLEHFVKAYPQGLYLSQVRYADLERPNATIKSPHLNF